MIPRRVHRIWLGPYRCPEIYLGYARQWEALGWPVVDWSWPELVKLPMSDATREVLADIEERGACAGGGIDATARWVQMADVLAYELVRCVGGVYANMDIEPLEDLPVGDLDAFVVAEDERFLSNALMGAVSDHPFFERVCATLPDRFWANRWAPMNQTTGPHHLTSCWLTAETPPVRIGPVPCFPVGFDQETATERPIQGHFVDHHWGHKHPERLELP